MFRIPTVATNDPKYARPFKESLCFTCENQLYCGLDTLTTVLCSAYSKVKEGEKDG